MVYVADEDFAVMRDKMAKNMLAAAQRSVPGSLRGAPRRSVEPTLDNFRELSAEILSQQMDIWPEHCNVCDCCSEPCVDCLKRRHSIEPVVSPLRRYLSLPTTVAALMLIAVLAMLDLDGDGGFGPKDLYLALDGLSYNLDMPEFERTYILMSGETVRARLVKTPDSLAHYKVVSRVVLAE